MFKSVSLILTYWKVFAYFCPIFLVTCLTNYVIILPISGLYLLAYLTLVGFLTTWLSFVSLQNFLQLKKPLELLKNKGDLVAKSDLNYKLCVEQLSLDIDKYFIEKWFVYISQERTFNSESHVILTEVLAKILQVGVALNRQELLHAALNLYLKHFKEYRRTVKRQEKYGGTLSALYRYSNASLTSRKSKEYYVHQLTVHLLNSFVNWEISNSVPYHILVAILSRKFGLFLLKLASNAQFLNYHILNSLAGEETRKELALEQFNRVKIVNVTESGSSTPSEVVEAPKQNRLQTLGPTFEPILTEDVKVYEAKSCKTWYDSLDLDSVTLGQDILDFIGDSDREIDAKEETITRALDSNTSPLTSAKHLMDDVKLPTLEGLKTSVSEATASTLSNMKELESTVSSVVKPMSQATSTALHRIGGLHLQDEAAGVVENLLDFGRTKFREGLRLTGLQESPTEGKSIKSEDRTIKNEDRTIKNGDRTIKNEDRTIKNEDRTINNEDRTLKKEDRTLQKEVGTIKKEDRSITNEDRTIKNEDRTIKNKDRTLKKEDRTIKNEDRTIKNEDRTIKNEDRTIKNEDRIIKNEDRNIKNEDRTLKNEDRTLKSEDRTIKSEASTLKNEDRTLKNEGRTTKSEDQVDKMSKIPSILTESHDENSPEPEYEETADLATSIAKLRSLLEQKSSESNISTPALSPMPSEEVPSKLLMDLDDSDGVMPSFYKFCAKTATGVFNNTLNTIKTALPAKENDRASDSEGWILVEAQTNDNDLADKMDKLLSERKAFCTVDTAYEAIDSLAPAEKQLHTSNFPFEDELDDFEIKCPIAKVLVDILCELLADSKTFLVQEPVIKSFLLLFGDYMEDFIEQHTCRFMAFWCSNIKIPEESRIDVKTMEEQEFMEAILNGIPDFATDLIGRDVLSEALKLFITSLQVQKINQDVVLQMFEIICMKLMEGIKEQNQMST